MKKRTIILLVALAAFFAWPKIKYRFLAPGTLPASFTKSDSPCLGKKMCSVIYVAPWCPACKQMAPMITDFLKNALEFDREVGILVVVGDGRSEEENKREADGLGKGAMIDQDRTIGRSLGVSYYPSFFVVDSSFKIVKRDQDALQWTVEQFGN